MKPTLVVMAAGMGSRYGGAKQIDQMGPSGETILEYSLHDAIDAGFKKALFVIREELKDHFEQNIIPKIEGKIEYSYVFQEKDAVPQHFDASYRTKPWGTGHAILMCHLQVTDPFLIINADDFYGAKAYQKAHEIITTHPDQAQTHLIGYTLKNTLSENGGVSRGICDIDNQSNIISVTEHKKVQQNSEGQVIGELVDGTPKTLNSSDIASMSLFVLHPQTLEEFPQHFENFLQSHNKKEQEEFMLPSILTNLIDQEVITMKAHQIDELWSGVTYREDKEKLQETIKEYITQGKYPQKLFSAE